MASTGQRARFGTLAGLVLLASCSHHHQVAEAPPPAPPPPTPRPTLSAELASVVPPAKDATGHYRTINSGIDPIQTEWHVRAALNVAAIGCRGPQDSGIIPAYNSLLTSQKKALAAANATVEGRYRHAGGDWQAAHDAYMTRLYNFFAQPASKAAFCAAADRLAPQAAAVPGGGFEAFAQQALPELEAPFLDTYRQVDDYRVALADWKAGRAATMQANAPQLAYQDVGRLVDWQPDQRLAMR